MKILPEPREEFSIAQFFPAEKPKTAL